MKLHKMDIPPTAQLVWKSGHDEVRKKLSTIVGGLWKAELLSVSHGLRECATTHIRSETFTEDWDHLRSLGLSFLPLRKCKRQQGFAHRFEDPKPGETFDIYGVVAKSLAPLERFEKAHRTGDHETIGALLGYPKSDREFFASVWPREFDPIWSGAKNTPGRVESMEGQTRIIEIANYYPECVQVLRYFGIRAVPQISSSMLSEETKESSEMYLRFVENREFLIEVLSAPITWDCLKGVALVETPWFIGIANSMPFREKHVVRLLGHPRCSDR